MEKQLNVWINADLKESMSQRALQKGVSLKEFVEDIFGQSMAQYQAEMLEKQALPIIEDMIERSLQKSTARQNQQMQEAFHTEIILPMKQLIRETDRHLSDRIASLSVRTVRDGSIIRHLLYALLAKLFSVSFARDAYEHAKEKAARELEKRVAGRGLEEDEG